MLVGAEYLMGLGIILIGILLVYKFLYSLLKKEPIKYVPTNEDLIRLKVKLEDSDNANKILQKEIINMQEELGKERENTRILLSQKKSSESRTGEIVEQIVPFLEGCPYSPRDLHFLGKPIDYLCVDFDQGEITLIEIKSGNSKPSARQKIIKNIIKAGRVYYAEIRVNDKGVKHKRYDNITPPEELKEEEEN